MTRFTVQDVFVLSRPNRDTPTTLLVGDLEEGTVGPGTTLHDPATGTTVLISGIDRLAPPANAPKRFSLILDPTSPGRPTPGTTLIDPPA